ncbi:SusC/RagA family TonB-linked outer membrane protein [Lacibacter sp.]|uniref:SusC/RagA family TonB-linked outer membrane protein n=1 Tax=Lacibacter sp. TaxID=1915409 RepID=UPI002B4B5195|nr:SusC/RagA family TonB-linked outer membrane protein [Lacibacter sp.]HLP37711.1 SusC/RagA family TonB-linked outer membrane protein [Lacibacter sp.]
MLLKQFTYIIAAACFVTAFPQTLCAQKKKQKDKAEVVVQNRTYTSVVTDENGTAISNALIIINEGVQELRTNNKGAFTFQSKPGAAITIEASGYATQILILDANDLPSAITLKQTLLLTSSSDVIRLPLSNTTTARAFTGANGQVSGAELSRYTDLSLHNTLQGRVMGLIVNSNSGGLGNNVASLYVRGLQRQDNNGALTLVDGIERPVNFINPEEIATVQVLKDPVSKNMYGPRAANGIILITTKRGKDNTKVIELTSEYGYSTATRLPSYLNSYQYAILFNEARTNDGLAPFYSQADLDGYKNSKGPNDQLYPNVDYYNYFIKKSAPIRRVTLNYSGGNTTSNYALVIGYTGAAGFEKIGKTPQQDRINLRGNLNFKVSNNFHVFADAAGVIESRNWSGWNQDQVFGALSTHRPNEYPLLITDSNLLKTGSPLGLAYFPPLGGSLVRAENVYGQLMYGGSTKHNYFYGQTNFGMDLGLNKLVKGLSLKSVFHFDNYQFFQSGRDNVPVTYLRQVLKNTIGGDSVVYAALRQRSDQLRDQRQGEDISRVYGLTASVNYNYADAVSSFRTSLTYFYYRGEDRNSYQNIENINTYYKASYGYKNKLYADGIVSMMGSNKFSSGNKLIFSPSIGAAWIVSEENFLKNTLVDFLKLKASFGVLGYDRATEFYLFQSRWRDNGSINFGEVNNTFGITRSTLDLVGNPSLKWEKSTEWEAGVEMLMLNKKLSVEFNYFNTLRSDIILNAASIYSSLAGGFYPRINLGKIRNAGIEAQVVYTANAGNVGITTGVNFVYSKNKILANNDVLALDPNLNSINNSTAAIYGYVAKGLFTSQQQIDNAPRQLIGPYTIGDIAYEDLNKDNIIDARDRKVIGNSFPPATFGLNLGFTYKAFSLSLLAVAQTGADNILNNSYYRFDGTSKYSKEALSRYHPVTNPSGTMPRLTSNYSANNNVTSTFWLQSSNFFRLRNAELGYTIINGLSVIKVMRAFVRGSNLFVLSKNKELDPEVLNAGITNYPFYRTVTVGLSFKF